MILSVIDIKDSRIRGPSTLLRVVSMSNEFEDSGGSQNEGCEG